MGVLKTPPLFVQCVFPLKDFACLKFFLPVKNWVLVLCDHRVHSELLAQRILRVPLHYQESQIPRRYCPASSLRWFCHVSETASWLAHAETPLGERPRRRMEEPRE